MRARRIERIASKAELLLEATWSLAVLFTVIFDYKTGKIKRVAFYALNILGGELLAIANDGLRKFFAEAPSYDK